MVGVLSLAPCYVRKKQVRDKGVPSSYHHGKAVSSLVDDCQTMHPPPANVRSLEKKKFYICSDVTHTHKPLCGRECRVQGSSILGFSRCRCPPNVFDTCSPARRAAAWSFWIDHPEARCCWSAASAVLYCAGTCFCTSSSLWTSSSLRGGLPYFHTGLNCAKGCAPEA